MCGNATRKADSLLEAFGALFGYWLKYWTQVGMHMARDPDKDRLA